MLRFQWSYLNDFVPFSNSAILCSNAVWINLKKTEGKSKRLRSPLWDHTFCCLYSHFWGHFFHFWVGVNEHHLCWQPAVSIYSLRAPCTTYLTNVNPSFILVIGPVTDRQAKLVLDIGSVQIHFLVRHMHKLLFHSSKIISFFFLSLRRIWLYIGFSGQTEYIDSEMGSWSNSDSSITVMNLSAGPWKPLAFLEAPWQNERWRSGQQTGRVSFFTCQHL